MSISITKYHLNDAIYIKYKELDLINQILTTLINESNISEHSMILTNIKNINMNLLRSDYYSMTSPCKSTLLNYNNEVDYYTLIDNVKLFDIINNLKSNTYSCGSSEAQTHIYNMFIINDIDISVKPKKINNYSNLARIIRLEVDVEQLQLLNKNYRVFYDYNDIKNRKSEFHNEFRRFFRLSKFNHND